MSNLEELSDESYQRRVWLGLGQGEMSSFDECACGLFDDSGLEDQLERGKEVYGSEIDNQLRELGKMLSRVDGRRPPKLIVEDPVLNAARLLSARLIRRLAR